MTTLILILAAIGAGVLTCFLAGLHMALRDVSYARLEELARGGELPAGVERILQDPEAHARAVGFARALASTLFVLTILALFPPVLAGPGSQDFALWLAAAAAVAALAGFVLAHLIPTSLSEHLGERMLVGLWPVIRVIRLAAAPAAILGFVDVAVARLAGVREQTEEEELAEELRSVVSEGEREGAVDESTGRMIEAVVRFRSRRVEEIMTPRTEMEGIELTDDIEAIKAFIRDAGHSRIPVYEGDLDHIIGLLYVKDLLPWVGQPPEGFRLRDHLRSARFVPESKAINELLIELQANKVHMAIVLDEYGGTTGLVTFEDILEEIVGEIQDEYEPDHETPPEIRIDIDNRAAELDARAYITDANDALEHINIEIPEGEEYDTVGGYVLNHLGHIPVRGESFRHNGYIVTILESEPTRVTRLRIEHRPLEDQAGRTNGNAKPTRDDD